MSQLKILDYTKVYQWSPCPTDSPEWVEVLDILDGLTYRVSGLEGIRRGRQWNIDPKTLRLPGRPLADVEKEINQKENMTYKG